MIYDSLAHIETYKTLHAGVYQGLKLLAETDFSTVEDKKYEVDGDNLFYFLQSYETKVENNTPESHQKYIDIQCVLTGAETMAVGALEDMTEVVEARPEGDIWLHHGPTDSVVTLSPGKFAVLWPGDAHAPGVAVGAPAQCRKVVVKVKV